jgi:hypothetical protein
MHEKSNVAITMVQLPALNTPQFKIVKSKLPHRAQPVPPIYQPEVAARAILWAMDHPRRHESWVGGTTAATIVANRVMPGLLDRYLARTGFSAQQTDQPEQPGRPSNLWEPVPGDLGAHGDFDDRSHAHSAELVVSTRKRTLAAAAFVATAVAIGRRALSR